MEERCVACGAVIPEGRQVCIRCEIKSSEGLYIPKKFGGFVSIDDMELSPSEESVIDLAIRNRRAEE